MPVTDFSESNQTVGKTLWYDWLSERSTSEALHLRSSSEKFSLVAIKGKSGDKNKIKRIKTLGNKKEESLENNVRQCSLSRSLHNGWHTLVLLTPIVHTHTCQFEHFTSISHKYLSYTHMPVWAFFKYFSVFYTHTCQYENFTSISQVLKQIFLLHNGHYTSPSVVQTHAKRD